MMKEDQRNQVPKGGSDVYLLKIYRRDRSHEESLVGTVEHVTKRKRKGFRTEQELLHCLEEMKKRESEEV